MKLFGLNIGSKIKRSKSGYGRNTLNFDMLYQLSYMSVIAAAGVPRAHIFGCASRIPCSISEYFRKTELVCQRLKYDYAKACQLVGEATKEEMVKTLLLRFSSSLISGEPESDFLSREAEAHARAYDNEYGRKLETLKMWTDAFVSLTMSSVLIIIMGIVSTMVWKVEMTFIIGLMAAAIGASIMGVWIIYLMSPREIMVLKKAGSREQKLAKKLFKLLVPAAVIVCGMMAIRGIAPGIIMMMGAALVFPIGYVAGIDDKKVNKRDNEIGSFLRSLGGVSAAIGTTVREALEHIDLKSIANLRAEARRLRTRLVSGIRSRVCWDKFIAETGSELVQRSVGMFYDAVDLGGEPEQAGYHASLFSTKIAMMRAKRKTVSSPFRYLCIAMHGAVISLLIFITESVSNFGMMVSAAQKDMPTVSGASISAFNSFNFSGLELLHSLVMPLIVVFSIANALAASVADGGSRYRIFNNLAVTVAVSGLCLTIIPTLSQSLFTFVKI